MYLVHDNHDVERSHPAQEQDHLLQPSDPTVSSMTSARSHAAENSPNGQSIRRSLSKACSDMSRRACQIFGLGSVPIPAAFHAIPSRAATSQPSLHRAFTAW